MNLRKIAAATVAVALAGAGLAVVAPLSASAHTGDLNATAVCNTATGKFDVTYKLTISQTGLAGDSKWGIGTVDFAHTPTNANDALLNKGTVHSTGAGVITLGTIEVAGNATKAPWAYAYTTWSDKFGKGSDGGDIALAGNCVVPDQKNATATFDISLPSCDVPGKLSYSGENVTFTGTANGSTTPGAVHVVAAATQGHSFTTGDPKTHTFDGTILGQTGPSQSTNPAGSCYVPPTVQNCPAIGNGGVSTNLNHNGWDFSETRSTGHNDYVESGLHVYTESNGSTDKAAGYHALSIPLAQVGEPSITLENSSGGLPSIQLGIDRDGNGTWDGYLVNEGDIYGHGNWWTNKTGFGVPAGGGYPSLGTLNAYLSANPQAKVVSFGYSLGSGVKGDTVIKQITVGCNTYTFDHETLVIPPKPADKVTHDSFTEKNCTTDVVTTHHTTTTITTKYDGASNTWVEQPAVTTNDPDTTAPATAEQCPVPTVCKTNTVLPVATQADPKGWGDLKNGTWTKDGIQLTATATDEAYAYVDLAKTFKLSASGSLATVGDNAKGSFGVILQTPDGKNIHFDSGSYWTVTPGIFPMTSPGFYGGQLSDLISDPDIYEVAVWVNPGGSLLLQSQSYNCNVQPFKTAAVVTPPTDQPKPPTTVVVAKPVTPAEALAFTGAHPELGLVGGALLLLIGGGLFAATRRRKGEHAL